MTLEFSNTTPLPAKIYTNEGVANSFLKGNEKPEVTYADRNGKYMGQTGVTLPKFNHAKLKSLEQKSSKVILIFLAQRMLRCQY